MPPQEAIYTSSEAKKKLIARASERGMTLDEYMAAVADDGAHGPSNGNGSAIPTRASAFGSDQGRARIQELQDVLMLQAAARGAAAGPAPSPEQGGWARIEARLDRIEARQAGPATPAVDADPLGMNSIMKEAMRVRLMTPLMKALGGDEEGGSGRALREVEREMRDKMERQADKWLSELRDKDRSMLDLKEQLQSQNLQQTNAMVQGLHDRIEDLTAQLQSGPLQGQPSVTDALTTSLKQAQEVQGALMALARSATPPPPAAPTGERDTVQTIAYLANELSGAVSKGIEAVARVKAANRGHNPDAIGRMPRTDEPPPRFQPRYVPDEDPAGAPPVPARRAPPAAATPGRLRAAPARADVTMPAGARLFFEGGRQMSSGPTGPDVSGPGEQGAVPPSPESLGDGSAAGVPRSVAEMPPLDPRIEQFVDPQGNPVSQEQYQQMRLDVWRKLGRDPVQVQRLNEPAEGGDGSAGGGEGASDSDSPEGQ